MDDEVRTDIAVIKVKMGSVEDQMKRFIAHVESERDVRAEQGKRIDLLSKEIEWMRERDKNSKWRIEVILSFAAVIIAFGTMVIMILK